MVDPRPIWQIVLVDGLGSARAPVSTIGELVGASDRQFNFNLNAAGTVSFTLPMDAPHALDILPSAGVTGCDDLILILRNGVLQMTCEISTLEITGADQEHSIAVTGTETMWVRLPKALLGQSSKGLAGPSSATDQGTWLAGGTGSVLSDYNLSTLDDTSGGGGDLAHTGIGTAGSITASGNISGGVWRYKPFMELMTDLAQSTSGFDFWQTSLDPRTDVGGGVALTGRLNIAPLRGAQPNSNVVFEYGTKFPNAASYHFTIDNTNEANRFVSLPPSFPDSAGLHVRSRMSTGRTAAMGMREMLVDADLSDADLRDALLKNYRDVLRWPRRVFEIQPMPQTSTGLVPQFIDDYGLGDTVRGRVIDRGQTLCDALVRVYGVSVQLDDTGMETDTVTWVQES